MKSTTKFACLALLGAAALLSSCGGKKQQQMAGATFKTMKVEKKSITFDTKFSATIRGCHDVEVYPQVGGTIKQILVEEGQAVKKGQTLFIIDQVPFQAALNTAEAQLKAAKAQQATAQLNYNSKKTLREQNVISDFDLQTAENTLLSAKASVAQAQASVLNASNSLSYTVVKAPADGVVGELPYRQGALVSSAMAKPLTTISDNHQMWVYFSVTEAQMLSMVRDNGSLNAAIKAMPAVRMLLVDGTEYAETGRVEAVSGVVDRTTGSIQLKAVFNNPQGLLHSGSTGNVIVPVTYNDAVVIPTTATVQLQDKYKVYAVDKDGIAKETIVTLSEMTNGKNAVVTSGLNGGETIVAEGAGMVKNGQKVK